MQDTPLKAVAFICSLKASPAPSSSELMASQVAQELKKYDVETELIRIADYNILPGVSIDMGSGDEWPKLRAKMLDADILLFATPIWVGHMCSIGQRVIERLDAELSETDDQGRLKTFGRVAASLVVGNEDGAHKVAADTFQALSDIGFTIPAGGSTYWTGEAMHKVDYNDLEQIPEEVATTNKTLAANTAHLARLLQQANYPAV